MYTVIQEKTSFDISDTGFSCFLSLTNLLGEDVVGEGSHAGGVGDEVGDRLHDVP